MKHLRENPQVKLLVSSLLLEHNSGCSLKTEISFLKAELNRFETSLQKKIYRKNSLILELTLLVHQSQQLRKDSKTKKIDEEDPIYLDDSSLEKVAKMDVSNLGSTQDLVEFAFLRSCLDKVTDEELKSVRALLSQK